MWRRTQGGWKRSFTGWSLRGDGASMFFAAVPPGHFFISALQEFCVGAGLK
jgi:hypothetical protein